MKYSSNREHVSLQATPKIILSKELQAQILYFHSVVGDIEWSGPLYYTIVSGSVEDLSSLVVKAEIMLPKDVGTPGYTEYTMGPEVMDFYDRYPQAMMMKIGHIHTHHNMNTYFSGTDMSELHDNAPNHNYYVSLIVNHKGVYSAKVAINGEVDKTVSYKGTNGSLIKEAAPSSNILMTADMEIEFEQDAFMIEAISTLIEKARAKAKKSLNDSRVTSVPNYYNPSSQPTLFDDWRNYSIPSKDSENEPKELDLTEYKDVIDFLPKLISLNPHTTQDLESVLDTLNKRFKGASLDSYITKVANAVYSYYDKYFTKDNPNTEISGIYTFILDCSIVLENYVDTNKLAEGLVLAFDDMYDVEN
jgi:proteasome lid subunit RPN8/RPN11